MPKQDPLRKLTAEQKRSEEYKKLNAALDGKPTAELSKKPKQNPKSDL